MRDEGQYRWGAISEECNNGNQTTFISVHYKASYTVALCSQFFSSLNESNCFSANVDEQVNFDFSKVTPYMKSLSQCK